MLGRKKVIREDRGDLESVINAAIQQAVISSRREAAKTAANAIVDIALDTWKTIKEKLNNEECAKFIYSTIWKSVSEAAIGVLFVTELVEKLAEYAMQEEE